MHSICSEIISMSAIDLHKKIISRELSCVEVTNAFLSRIREVDKKVNAFITVTDELAIQQAEAIDMRVSAGEKLPLLAGVPIAIKDNISTKGILTTCASKILHNYVPPYDATVVEKLKQQGMIFIGKTNHDQFGMGSSNENTYYGPTRNPWDLERVPGGTSGGSTAAVAARETPLALATDTGGSSRQPASLCGVIGFKPTYGRISRYGLLAYASSLDQIGIVSRDATECAQLLSIIAGHDPMDSTSVPRSVPNYTENLSDDLKGIKLGIPAEFFGEGLDKEVECAIRRTIELLCKLGAECVEVSLPLFKYAIPTYYLISTPEASSNLSRYDGVNYGFRANDASSLYEMYTKTRGEGFMEETKRRIILGTYALRTGYYDKYYTKAQQIRTLIISEFQDVFKKCDILVGPTSPFPAFRLGEKLDDPIAMYLSDIYTVTANLAGIPATSVPAGFTSNGLPIGIQFQGNYFSEETLLKLVHALQQHTCYHLENPRL